MNVFIHILRSLIIAAIASIGIYAGYSYFADVRTPQILETPKNTDVITLLNHVNEDKLPANPDDMCIDYLKNLEDKKNSKPKPEDLNVQDIIGYQNNKFGLYIYRVDSFAEKAAEMVNSNGGDWGYVLVPYNVKDYDEEKWAKFFETLHRYHLIPIIQLWDTSKDFETQVKETRKAAQFLNNLRWPIKYRYISVYNEVNDEKFWKTGVDPEGYARLLSVTIDIFKGQSTDFFILNGAFNASAQTGGGYLDERVYLQRMEAEVPGVLKKLDGWASHPYPHVRGYLGTPEDSGRASIRAYEWELDYLKNEFGVNDLPVFITETGWPHKEGEKENGDYYDEETVSKFLKKAFENVWLKDDRVVAVTPFTIKYDPPFDHFSFIKSDGGEYKHFKALKGISKVAGYPPILPNYDPLKEKCIQLERDKNQEASESSN